MRKITAALLLLFLAIVALTAAADAAEFQPTEPVQQAEPVQQTVPAVQVQQAEPVQPTEPVQPVTDYNRLANRLRQIPVLVYHHILPDAVNLHFRENRYTISTESFELQMQYLADNGFTPITLTQLEQFMFWGQPLPPRAVKIHFDDGYLSNFVYAYPILARHGFRATVFMITANMQQLVAFQPPMDHSRLVHTSPLTAHQAQAVFETASHSHDMHRLAPHSTRTVFAEAGFAEVLNDTRQSLPFVANRRGFAYPHGQYSAAAVEALRAAGLMMGFTTRAGNITAASDPFSLPRFTIHRDTPFDRFIEIVEGAR